jgi:hypothetical protein
MSRRHCEDCGMQSRVCRELGGCQPEKGRERATLGQVMREYNEAAARAGAATLDLSEQLIASIARNER